MNISNLPPAAATQIIFDRDIRPILENNCIRCHGPEKTHNGFRLDNRLSALKGGENGVDILPGNSANSPLIQYVAYLVKDLKMPPAGKGNQLTTNQVALLRAWIDQGVVWDTNSSASDVHGYLSSVVGGTIVGGDKYKYQEQYWQKAGVLGGEEFHLFQQVSPDTRWLVDGHVFLPNDYEINYSEDRTGLGFIHSGWQQYRKYYDDTGGYEPSLVHPAPALGEDLYLDIGKAWVDFGLTLPDWPQIVLGYEYDYRRGNEATTEWGAVGSSPTTARNIGPASASINESVNIIKFDLNDDIYGVAVAEDFRGEFYRLATGSTNTMFRLTPQTLNNGTTWFQGANTIRLEKKFNDWFSGSAGYLYSKLNADSSFSMDTPSLLQMTSIPNISLYQESNVGNVNGLLGPFKGLIISSGVQAEWDQQHGFGAGNFVQEIPPPPFTESITPFTVSSDYNETSVQENLAASYSKIPYTGLYAEARLEQDNIDQNDQFAAPVDILDRAVFNQHTDAYSRPDDLRAGFDTSPWRTVSFSAYYRFYNNFTRYDSSPLIQPVQTAYPTFLLSDDTITHEVHAELVLHPLTRFKTSLSYQYETSDYDMNTRPYVTFGSVISPGGELTAGHEYSHIFSINPTFTPWPRLYLSTMFSWEISSLDTADDNSKSVVPYRGHVYTLLADATYVLTQTTDLFAGYFLSEANYSQDNYAGGLPLGIEYEQQSIQVALTHRFSESVSTKLLYRYAFYDEPSSGGATNYHANSIFGTLTVRF